MTRRSLLTHTGLAPFTFSPVGAQSQAKRPNFIVIMVDDLGSADLGCYGAKDLRTPNIDALAQSGARFTNWYSNSSVCAPARASLMTGRYPSRAGVETNGAVLSPEQQTIASLLKTNSYATGLVGKWHLGVPGKAAPNDRGFDEFYGFHSGCVDFYSHRFYWGEPRRPNYHDLYRNRQEIFEDGRYLTERLTEEATGFIDRRKDQPFFLYLAYNAPHYPMHAPQKYLDRFPDLAEEKRVYAGMISAVDDGVGAVMKQLEQSGIADNTCVFFLGDNGATTEARAGLNGKPATAGSNGAYRGFKFSLFDGGMHVPGIIRWPEKVRGGQVIEQITMTMDVLPTICKASGTAVPNGYVLDGSDVMPLAQSGGRSPHDAIFWKLGPQLAVRRGKWKLVLNGILADRSPDSRKPMTGEDSVFLSDLSIDPGETKNLRRVHPGIVDELSTLAHEFGRGGQ